jgi:hypothetical protein
MSEPDSPVIAEADEPLKRLIHRFSDGRRIRQSRYYTEHRQRNTGAEAVRVLIGVAASESSLLRTPQ